MNVKAFARAPNPAVVRKHDPHPDVFDCIWQKLLWEKSYEGGCDRMAIRLMAR